MKQEEISGVTKSSSLPLCLYHAILFRMHGKKFYPLLLWKHDLTQQLRNNLGIYIYTYICMHIPDLTNSLLVLGDVLLLLKVWSEAIVKYGVTNTFYMEKSLFFFATGVWLVIQRNQVLLSFVQPEQSSLSSSSWMDQCKPKHQPEPCVVIWDACQKEVAYHKKAKLN